MKVSGTKASRIGSLVLIAFVLILSGAIVFLIARYKDLDERYEKLYNSEVKSETKTSASDGTTIIEKEYLSKDEALDVVLKDLNAKKEDLYDLDIEIENKMKYENTIFEISFDYNRYEYEYYVDAVTGKILDSFQSRD